MSNIKPTYVSPVDGTSKPVDTSADSISANAVYVQNSATPDTAVGISRDGSDNLVLTDAVSGSKTLADLASAGAAPGGVANSIQTNDGAGGFGGDANLTYTSSKVTLTDPANPSAKVTLNPLFDDGVGFKYEATNIGPFNNSYEIQLSNSGLNLYTDSTDGVGAASLSALPDGVKLDSTAGTNALLLGTQGTASVQVGSASAPVNISGAFALPLADGTSGQVLATDGAGAVSWAAVSGGTEAGQKEPVVARYDFTGTSGPTVPVAPTAPVFTGTERFVGSGGGEYATLALAVAASSPGDIITVRAGYTTTETSLTTVTVNKSLEIRGENRATSGISGVAGSAGGNFLITVAAGVNDVWIHDLTITNNVTAAQDPGGISANIAAGGMTEAIPNGSTGLRFERLNLIHWKFGISIQGNGWVINDCAFSCRLATAGTTIRHIGHYGQVGNCFITNCVITPTTDATPRSQAIYMTTNFPGVGTYRPGQAGNLVVQNLSQSGLGNWNAYYLQDVMHEPGAATGSGYNNPATPGSFSLWFDNVAFTTPYSGNSLSVLEATGTIAPLAFFSTLYFNNCVGQARTTGDGKGFFAVAGSTGSGRSIGSPTSGFWVFGSNTFNSNPSGTYVEGSTVDNLLGVLTTNFATPSPLLSPTVPVYVPSGTLTADGVSLALADRVFLFNTSDSTYSGLYVVASGTWTRATDMAAGANASNYFWWVTNGTTYANTGWVVSSVSGSAVVGTNSLSFRQFGGLGGESYTVGNSTFWAAPAPTNVWAALDRLASAVYALRGNVAIP